jgi:death-on-curing protein
VSTENGQQFSYLSLADVVALHTLAMERSGYVPAPLRDAGALESAVLKPQMAAYYQGADLDRQGALLAVGIAQAQAFIDGNKRTAYAALDVFLRLNHTPFNGDPVELAKQLEALAERTDSLDAATSRFEAWLRQFVE